MRAIDNTIDQITLPTPFAVGDVHVYLLKGDTLSLVDAGVKTIEAWEAFTFQLKELGYTPNDIEQIILTHHHPDHTGLIEQLPRIKNIIAHQSVDVWLTRDENYFKHYQQFYKEYFIACGIPQRYHFMFANPQTPLKYAGNGKVTIPIDEGDLLPGHTDWQIIETKGHAQSHLSFYRDSDGTFIGGDHLLYHISSNPLLEPPHLGGDVRPKPLLQYRANLNKCLTLGIKTVLPGHGPVFSNVNEIIPERLIEQEQRADKVYQLLKETTQTPFQICQQIFPRQYENQLDLTMSETIGQLDFLEDKGVISKTVEGGVIYYNAK